MTQDYPHPITPPPELVQQWLSEIWHEGTPVRVAASDLHIATQAAQWASDQELEACLLIIAQLREWSTDWLLRELRAARRPKPPSLKEQSIALLDLIQGNEKGWQLDDLDVVRRALEQLA